MKVLIVNKFLHPNGGSETYIFQIGKSLETKGHKVEYFGMEHERRCVGNSLELYTSNMDFHMGSKIKKLTYPIKTIYSYEAKRKIIKVLDNFDPDVVHINNFNYQLTPSIILGIVKWKKKKKKKCKIVYTAHDYQLLCPCHLCYIAQTRQTCEKCLNGKFINCTKNKCIHGSRVKSLIGTMEAMYWNARKVYRNIDTIICCSEFLKQKMDSNKIFAVKTVAMHNFVDPVKSSGINKQDYIMYFGRFSDEKGVNTLVDVCKKLGDLNFVFAGSGSLQEKIDKVPNIRNVGFKKGNELKELVEAARFTICPSEWYENCPFSVMESQMLGTPVLGADIGGIPELIEVGKTGELFESGNEKDLTEKIRFMWNKIDNDPQYYAGCKNVNVDDASTYVDKLLNKVYK